MTEGEWALRLHLVAFALLFSGMAVAAVAHEGARRRERAGEVAALLALTRVGVASVAAGSLPLRPLAGPRPHRGRPHVCNACSRKPSCTDSDEGREVVRFLDEWPRLEAGRFHRGLAFTLIVLAALMAAAALVRHHDPAEATALGGVLALSAIVGRRLAPVSGPR